MNIEQDGCAFKSARVRATMNTYVNKNKSGFKKQLNIKKDIEKNFESQFMDEAHYEVAESVCDSTRHSFLIRSNYSILNKFSAASVGKNSLIG